MISIVIPAFNEEKNLPKTLENILRQKTGEKFEVLVVDNNSQDKTIIQAKKYSQKLNLKIFQEKKQGRGAARKKGFDQAQGEIIFSTDADTLVPPDWLTKHLKILENKEVIAVSGFGFIKKGPLAYNRLFPIYVFLYKLILGHYPLHGFNFSVRKSVYRKSSGFDKNLNNQEDMALGFKLAKIGQIAWTNQAPVTVSSRRFQKGLIAGLTNPFLNFTYYLLFKKNKSSLENLR